MGFIADHLADGRQFRLLTCWMTSTARGLGIELDFSLPAGRMVRSLNQIIEWHGKPLAIRVDNGPEYISSRLMVWAEKLGIALNHIQPGKPLMSSVTTGRAGMNGWTTTFLKASRKQIATGWLRTYNNERPNMSTGRITLAQKLLMAA